MPAPQLALLIPAYNEAATLDGVLNGALQKIPASQIIVIDDGSTDDTADIARRHEVHLIQNPRNCGKAYSLWQGMQRALSWDVTSILTLDADGQHLADDIPEFIRMGEAHPRHIIIGSRLHDKASIPRKRYIANRIANFWLSWVAGYPIKDSQCGFRLYPAFLLKGLRINVDKAHGFVFESEILIKAAHRGVYVKNVRIEALYAQVIQRHSYYRGVADTTRITLMVMKYLFTRFFCLINLSKYIYRGLRQQTM